DRHDSLEFSEFTFVASPLPLRTFARHARIGASTLSGVGMRSTSANRGIAARELPLAGICHKFVAEYARMQGFWRVCRNSGESRYQRAAEGFIQRFENIACTQCGCVCD